MIKLNRRTVVTAAFAAVVTAAGLAAYPAIGEWRPVVQASEAPGAPRSKADAAPSFADLASRVSPAVVNIRAVSVVRTDFPDQLFGENFPFRGFGTPLPRQPEQRRQGTGSGFIIRKDGLILTNNHVVENAREITVTLNDKQQYKARILGRDPKTDLAVLKIDPKGTLPVAVLGNSDSLRVGDWVMAIGNPFGLSNTVTTGIVSAKGRVIGAGPYDDFIQTDASINPGNSGGPLFNLAGEVVGINTAIFSQSGGNIGIGFAIPVNLVKNLVPELEAKGTVTRGWLGVSVQPMTAELARSFGLEQERGALVADVTADGPAAKAGIQRGDVIVGFDGKKVEHSTALPGLVAAAPVGKTVPVEILRDGKTRTLNVGIGRLNEPSVANAPQQERGEWGLALQNVPPDQRYRMGLPAKDGVLVTAVEPNSPAQQAGVQAGDLVLQVNRKPVSSIEEVKAEIAKTKADKPLLLLLRRSDGSTSFAALSRSIG
jgi:serine protease Do